MAPHSSTLAWKIPWTEEPRRLQPIRFHIPWDFPGKNTRVGCHLLLQCMKVKRVKVKSCQTICNTMDCSLPGSSVHGIFQARKLDVLLQGIFLTQGSNLGLLHCRQMCYRLNYWDNYLTSLSFFFFNQA